MIDFDTFPLKKFVKILEDEKRYLESFKISKEDWEYLKQEWGDVNQTPEMQKVIEAYRKVLVERLKISKNTALFRVLLTIKDENPKEFFETAKVRYYEDPEERFKYLNKEIKKSQQKLKIYEAQREQIENQLKEHQKEESPSIDINEVLASLELHGFNIGDYESLTIGKYLAMTKVIKKKEKANKNGK